MLTKSERANDDVAGIDEVEAEINEVVDFLKDPEKNRRLGARAPKGVLLAGPPGAGKAKVPFFSASASEFIEMKYPYLVEAETGRSLSRGVTLRLAHSPRASVGGPIYSGRGEHLLRADRGVQ